MAFFILIDIRAAVRIKADCEDIYPALKIVAFSCYHGIYMKKAQAVFFGKGFGSLIKRTPDEDVILLKKGLLRFRQIQPAIRVQYPQFAYRRN